MRALIARVTAQSAALAVVLMVGAIGLDAWRDHQAAIAAEQDRQVEQVAAVLAVTTEENALRAALARANPSGRLTVHLADGSHVGASRASGTQVDEVARHGLPRTVDTGDGRSLLLPVTAAAAAGSTGGVAVIELYLPDSTLGETTAGVAAVVGVFGLIGLVAVGLAVVTADRLTAPTVSELRGLAGAAATTDSGRLPQRPSARPRTGVAELAAIATMIQRVGELASALVAREHKMIADVSHRLRTPLAALRLDADAVGQGPVAERIRNAVVALEHDVDDIIRAAGRPPEPIEASSTRCDVSDVVRRRMQFWCLLATNQDRACEIDCPDEPTPIALADDDVAAIIDTLIGNIFRHTRPGTPLAVTVGRHDGWVSLVVDDGGPGIADPEAALRRGVSSGGSTGLGLDIARAGAESTGGTIHIERGKLGGARVRLRFAEAGSFHDEQPRAWRLWPGRPDD